jgi:predicted ATPase
MLQEPEGNPFHREVVRTLIDRGLVRRDPSGLHWQASEGSQEIGVPDNLQTMLLARIDRLESGARRSLQQASVIGRTFQKPVLRAIAEQVDQLDQHLVDLQRAELIREAAAFDAEYMFHTADPQRLQSI